MKLTLVRQNQKLRKDLPLLTKSREHAIQLRDQVIAFLPHSKVREKNRPQTPNAKPQGFFVPENAPGMPQPQPKRRQLGRVTASSTCRTKKGVSHE
jgi:hypothetical protein